MTEDLELTAAEAHEEVEADLKALEEAISPVAEPQEEPAPAPEPEPAPAPKAKKSKKVEATPERLPTGHSPEPTEAPDPKTSGIAAQLYGAAKLKAKFLKR